MNFFPPLAEARRYLYNQGMNKLRNAFALLILGLLCVLLLRASGPWSPRPRLWLGGEEITQGGVYPCGEGTAEYDPESGTLTLRGAVVEGDFRGAALYAEGDLLLRLEGENLLEGYRRGATVLGDLTLTGEGRITFSGHDAGAAVRGCVTLFDRPMLTLVSNRDKPLLWGKIHAAPNVVQVRETGLYQAFPPCWVTQEDGRHDAASHPLPEDGAEYPAFLLPMGSALPVPEEPVREGYWFGGWYTDPDLTEEYDFSLPVTKDTTLYLRWIQIVTVHFDTWGGTPVPDIQVAWGDTCPLPEDTEREYWDFVGWYSDRDLENPYDFDLAVAYERTVYAKWQRQAEAVGRGLDVARYQGEIDWETVAKTQDFVFIRLGFRGYGEEGTLNLDDNFTVNMDAALETGLDVGVYFFSQATSEAEALEEADFVLEALEPYSLTLPVIMDYELATTADGSMVGRLYEAGLSGEEYGRICAAFCLAVEKEGYTAGVYAGRSMLEEGVAQALEEAGGFPVWLANWTVQTRYNGDFTYWQYSGSGSAAGITGAVDQDIRYIIRPEQVAGLTAEKHGSGCTLRWDKIPGALGYIILRSTGEGSGYTEVARVTGAGILSWTDRRVSAGYRYIVCAYISHAGTEYRGPMSEPVQIP